MPEIVPLTSDKQGIIGGTNPERGINGMRALGGDIDSGTLISEGIKWGRHVLTPEPPYTEGGPKEQFRKIMILFTDGQNDDGTCPDSGGGGCNPKSRFRRGGVNGLRQCGAGTNAYWGQNEPKIFDCASGCAPIVATPANLGPEDVVDCNCDCLDAVTRREADLAKEAGIEVFVVRFSTGDLQQPNPDSRRYRETYRNLLRYVASTPTDDHYFEASSVAQIEDKFREIGRHLGLRLLP